MKFAEALALGTEVKLRRTDWPDNVYLNDFSTIYGWELLTDNWEVLSESKTLTWSEVEAAICKAADWYGTDRGSFDMKTIKKELGFND
jgi:hypothetical protein